MAHKQSRKSDPRYRPAEDNMELDQDNQSDNVEDRRGAVPTLGDRVNQSLMGTHDNAVKRINQVQDVWNTYRGNPDRIERANKTPLGRQLGFADGGAVPGDTEDDTNDTSGAPASQPAQDDDGDVTGSVSGATGSQPAIPTSAQPQAAPAPGYAQEGPFTPEQEQLNTREKALDKSGLGGAFGSAQHKRIDDARQQLVQQIIQHGLTSHGIGTDATPGGNAETAGGSQDQSTNTGAVPTSNDPDIGPPARAVRAAGQSIVDAASGYAEGWKRLLGHSSMDHATAEKIVAIADPDTSNPTPSLDAVKKANDIGGPDAAVDFMKNRVDVYNAALSFATAAYDGKNMQSSIDAANKAFKALPLAEQISLAAGKDGNVTATITNPANGQPIAYNLTPGQYRELIRGRSGFPYDILMQGPHAVLAKLTTEDHGEAASPNSQGVKPGPNGPVPDSLKAEGVNQAKYNNGWLLFPWASQAVQRNRYFLGEMQEQSRNTQALALSKQQGENKSNAVDKQVTGRQNVADTKAAEDLTKTGLQTASREHNVNARIAGGDRKLAEQVREFNQKQITQGQDAAQKAQAIKTAPVIKGWANGTLSEADRDEGLKQAGTSWKELMAGVNPTGAPQVQTQQAPTPAPAGGPGQGAPQGKVYKGVNSKGVAVYGPPGVGPSEAQ